jgi:dipeptidyl-peptidase-4
MAQATTANPDPTRSTKHRAPSTEHSATFGAAPAKLDATSVPAVFKESRVRQPLAPLGLYLGLAVTVVVFQGGAAAQDRLRSMPGYAQYNRMATQLAGALQSGSVTVTWSADGKGFEYVRSGRRYRYDVATRLASEVGDAAGSTGRGSRGGRGGAGAPERGRQYTFADSPDKTLRAQHNESTRNLHLIDQQTKVETPITTGGSREKRVKYGTASWVYGEELGQTTAMWWSPDGRKLAFYRFDESEVPDYFLQLDQTKIQSAVDTEAYPKAGSPNPIVDLLIYDVASKRTLKLDLRDGKPFDNSVMGHYVYRVAWSPDGKELLFNRTNRRQNALELVAANPDSGALRVILREDWTTGWVDNTPLMAFLKDGRRFIWESERNGWKNLYLYDLNGTLLHPLTAHTSFEVASLIKVDEQARVLFYTARDGDNHLKLQLHRVGLDGKGDIRLTDPRYHHTIGGCIASPSGRGGAAAGANCGISPDGAHFVDVYQTHSIPPASRLVDARSGKVIAEIAESNTTRYLELGLKKAELFTFKSADGQTMLHGLIQFPSNFDPTRRYPVLVPVYGGPGAGSSTTRETFVTPNAQAEYGFLIVSLDSRAAPGRGKRTLDQIYLKLGQVEIDDMAAGVRSLASRPYVDLTRVGIYGTSYGGYTSLMSILRHPDLYAAASASSPVTSWSHYDSIYTERYMWIPEENKAGYDAGSAMTYARNLKGRLMLYYGTADNNVHPSNMMQLIAALQAAGKSFEVQVGPDRGHSAIHPERMMEFFIENLVMKPATLSTSSF